MRRGETIVWDGGRLHRYPAKMKDEARARHRQLFENVGLDTQKILDDTPSEVTKLAPLVASGVRKGNGNVVPMRSQPDLSNSRHPAVRGSGASTTDAEVNKSEVGYGTRDQFLSSRGTPQSARSCLVSGWKRNAPWWTPTTEQRRSPR